MSSKIPTRGPEPWPDHQSLEVGRAHGDEVTAMFDAADPPPQESAGHAVEEPPGEMSLADEFFDQNDPYADLTQEAAPSKPAGAPEFVLKARGQLRSMLAGVQARLEGRTFDPVLLVPVAVSVAVGLLMGLAGQSWLVPAVAAGASLGLLARLVSPRLLMLVALVLCLFAASWVLPGSRPAFWMTQAVLLVAVASGRLR